jgi:hypothetical protein
MKAIELSLILVAAAGLAMWRGVALYRYAFRKKRL